MSVQGGEIYFSQDCPAAGYLAGRPISAKDFVLHVHPRPGSVELIAAFRHPTSQPDERLYSEAITEPDFPADGKVAQLIVEATEAGADGRDSQGIRSIGAGLCRSIANCKGAQRESDGGLSCPAYNKKELIRAILEVTE